MHVIASALAGALLLLAPATGALALQTGLAPEPDVSIKSEGGPVYAVFRQPDGMWLVGGGFTRVDGVERRGLARLHPDGSLDESFSMACSLVCHVETFVVLPDGAIILGGYFDTVGGFTANGLAKVGADGARVTAWNPGLMQDEFSSRIDELVLTDDGLLVLGRFLGFGGLPRPYLARIDPDGTGEVDAGYDARGAVTAYPNLAASLLLPSGEAFVAQPGPDTTLVRVAADGSAVGGFSDEAVLGNATALAYDAANDLLYIGAPLDGDAGDDNEVATAKLGRLDGSTGAFDATWIPLDDDSPPDALLLDGDALVVSSGWSSPHRIRVLDADDASVVSSFGPSGTNDAFVRLFDRAGPGFGITNFLEFTGREVSFVEVSRDGGIVPGLDLDIGNDVFVHQVERAADGSMHLLGTFSYVDRTARHGLARLASDGTLDPGFVPPRTFASSMAVTPAGVFVAGFFQFIGGTPQTVFAKLDPTSGALRPWAVSGAQLAPGKVFAGPDGNLYVAGEFGAQVCGGAHAGQLARVGTGEPCVLDAAFQPNVAGMVHHVLDDGEGHLYIAGSFASVGGTPRAGLARIDRTTGALDTTWVPPPEAAMYGVGAIAMGPEHLYFTGHRMSDLSNGIRVLRISRDTAAFTPFGPSFDQGVQSLRVGEGNDRHLYVAGAFEYVGEVPQRLFARLSLDTGELDPDFAPRVDGSFVRDVETTDTGEVVFSGSLHRVDGASRKRIAGYSVVGEVILRDGFE